MHPLPVRGPLSVHSSRCSPRRCKVASCVSSEEKYEEARLKFVDAITASGYAADLAYNIALCYYRQGQYGPALKHIAEIIEKGVREHPELSVGSNTDGIEVSMCWMVGWARCGRSYDACHVGNHTPGP
jgi:hypothetical protein